MSSIEDQANYYKNLHLRDRSIVAAIHLEDSDDKPFWNTQLQNVRQGHYYFISHSKSDNEKDAKGCEQCLKFRPYLNSGFFICIDSDLRLLRMEEGLTAENKIAQTYAYSWENHYCEASHLQYRFKEKVTDSDFDFEIFFGGLSRIVYKPLLYLIYHKTSELNSLWNVTKFNKCLPLQPSRNDLKDNGEEYLRKAASLFEDAIRDLVIPADFTAEGLTPQNAYLHIQGHRLYDLVMHIGSILCNGTGVRFKTEILDSSTHTSGYEEIDSVQSDLNKILGA